MAVVVGEAIGRPNHVEMRKCVELEICKRLSPFGTAPIGTNKPSTEYFGAVEDSNLHACGRRSTSSSAVCQLRHDDDEFHR